MGSTLGLIPESRRFPREGNGTPVQYSCLGNLMDRGAWWPTVHGLAKESDMTERLNKWRRTSSFLVRQNPHCSLSCLLLSCLLLSFLPLFWLLFFYWTSKCWWRPGFFQLLFSYYTLPLTDPSTQWLQLLLAPDDIYMSSPDGSAELWALGSITHLQLDVPSHIYPLPLKPWFLLERQHQPSSQPNQKTENTRRLSSPLPFFPLCSLVFLPYQLYLLYIAHPLLLLCPHSLLFSSSLSKPDRSIGLSTSHLILMQSALQEMIKQINKATVGHIFLLPKNFQ